MAYLIAYIATIFAANVAIQTWGIVPVGFGLYAPAGVYFVGLAFTLRDLAQERVGRKGILLAIAIGAALSALVSPQFALASGVAFALSEFADFAIYTPLRKRNWLGAVALSNTVGLVLDSALFLWLAFGSLDFMAGQVVGKAYMTILALPVLWAIRRANQTIEVRACSHCGKSIEVSRAHRFHVKTRRGLFGFAEDYYCDPCGEYVASFWNY